MPVLFAVTLFVSATLLFMVQPMVGKMILPLLGGSPAAWNTCMVFFQGLLLIGYLYAHNLTSRTRPARQAAVHLTVLVGAIVWMVGAALVSPDNSPVAVVKELAPQGQAYPMFGVLTLLSVAVGIPFLVVSTSAPLLQRWFAYTGHPSARDPYFLYAASNAGSLISLLGYPFFLEPSFTLAGQAWLFAGGFVLLTGLVFVCARAMNSPLRPPPSQPKAAAAAAAAAPTVWNRLRWLGLAFVPSSLMLGVTFHMTTDIASVPLLWVIPLALYLLTFIIAFGRTPPWFRPLLANLSPVLTLLLVFILISNATANFSTFLTLTIHLVVYFFTALLMHTELARARPHPAHLTQYYLWISIGGVLGGLFNALVAPVAFPLAYEYPIAIAIGCLLIPSMYESEQPDPRRWLNLGLDFLIPVAMVALVAGLTLLPEKTTWFTESADWIAAQITAVLGRCGSRLVVSRDPIVLLTLYALPCVICFFFIDRPVRFGLCVAAILFVNYYRAAESEAVEISDRSFFGILKVETAREVHPLYYLQPTQPDESGERPVYLYRQPLDFYKLSHGTTLHGMQAMDTRLQPLKDDLRLLGATSPWELLLIHGAQHSWDARQEPLTYYPRTGPVGAIFRRFRAIDPSGEVAMVGLGTGSAAAYALPGQTMTFYEIDPEVIEMVVEPRVMNPKGVANGDPPLMGPFTFIADARKRGATIRFELGDARLKLEENRDARYGLLLIDAFSSDSIPVHLLTREAVALYMDRVTEDGLVGVHISNRYIDLEPVVEKLARETDLVARIFSDDDQSAPGKTRSSWVILAKSEADLGDEVLGRQGDDRFAAVAGGPGWFIFDNAQFGVFTFPWKKLKEFKALRPWTDDYSDVLAVMRLEEIRWIRRVLGFPVLGEESENKGTE